MRQVAMVTGTEFVTKLEVVMGQTVSPIVGQSLLNYHLTKLNKDSGALSSDDCKILIHNIIKAISLFVTKEEVVRVQSELDKLFITHFS